MESRVTKPEYTPAFEKLLWVVGSPGVSLFRSILLKGATLNFREAIGWKVKAKEGKMKLVATYRRCSAWSAKMVKCSREKSRGDSA